MQPPRLRRHDRRGRRVYRHRLAKRLHCLRSRPAGQLRDRPAQRDDRRAARADRLGVLDHRAGPLPEPLPRRGRHSLDLLGVRLDRRRSPAQRRRRRDRRRVRSDHLRQRELRLGRSAGLQRHSARQLRHAGSSAQMRRLLMSRQVTLADEGLHMHQTAIKPATCDLDFGDGASLNLSSPCSSPTRAPPLPAPGTFGTSPQVWPTVSPPSSFSSGRSAVKAVRQITLVKVDTERSPTTCSPVCTASRSADAHAGCSAPSLVRCPYPCSSRPSLRSRCTGPY